MTKCPQCGLSIADASLDSTQGECPACGFALDRTPPAVSAEPDSTSILRRYFSTIWSILTRPTAFFRKMPVRGGISYPLAFALVTHWLGSAIEYLWRATLGGYLNNYVDTLMRMAGDVAEVDSPGRRAAILEMKEQFTHWMWGAGAVVADPFKTLFSVFFTAVFVYAGARILVTPGKNGAPSEITFESALRIVCFGLTPSLLAGVPLAGWFLSTFGILIVTVIGAREVYRISTGRALVVALFPKILLFGVIGMMLAGFIVVIARFFLMGF